MQVKVVSKPNAKACDTTSCLRNQKSNHCTSALAISEAPVRFFFAPYHHTEVVKHHGMLLHCPQYPFHSLTGRCLYFCSLPKRLSGRSASSLRPRARTGERSFPRYASCESAKAVLLSDRPIPQWFRLKTDTKIQVRCVVAFSNERLSDLRLWSPVQREAEALETHQAQHLGAAHSSYRHCQLDLCYASGIEGRSRQAPVVSQMAHGFTAPAQLVYPTYYHD